MQTQEKTYRSYLIQRLQKPLIVSKEAENTPLGKLRKANPFCFGGGLKNGGISDEAMSLLMEVFRFDYMGAAEYEFGAVPKALEAFIKAEDKVGVELTVDAKQPDYYYDENHKYCVVKERKTEKKSVYVLCPNEMLDHVTKLVKLCAKGEPTGFSRVRDYVGMPRSLFHCDDHSSVGWLEVDNGFMFFTDKEMFEKMCLLFEVSIEK